MKFLHHLVAWLNPFPPGTSKRASAIDCPEVWFVQKNIEKTKKTKKNKKNNIYKLFGEGPLEKNQKNIEKTKKNKK